MKKLIVFDLDGTLAESKAASIDITKPGIDKAYGIKKLYQTPGIAIDEMIFVSDALFEGGNDPSCKKNRCNLHTGKRS